MGSQISFDSGLANLFLAGKIVNMLGYEQYDLCYNAQVCCCCVKNVIAIYK